MGDIPLASRIVGFIVIAAVILYFAAPVLGSIYGLGVAVRRGVPKGLKTLKERRNAPRKADPLSTYWPAYVAFPFFLIGMGKAELTLDDLRRNRPYGAPGGISDREAWNLLAFCGWTWFVRGDEAAAEFLKVGAAYYDWRRELAEDADE